MLTMRGTALLVIALLMNASGAFAQAAAKASAANPAVVFVCEHGAAKSVIATAYFNKLAAERGLPYRATFRGTTPQEALSVRAVARPESRRRGDSPGCADGDWRCRYQDMPRTSLRLAARCRPLQCRPAKPRIGRTFRTIKVYEGQRDAIVRHVKELLDDLQRRGQ